MNCLASISLLIFTVCLVLVNADTGIYRSQVVLEKTAGDNWVWGGCTDGTDVYSVGFTSGTANAFYDASYTGQESRGFITKRASSNMNNLFWSRLTTGTGAHQLYSCAAKSNIGIIVVGTTSATVDEQTNIGSDDIFISRYSVDGTKLWTRQFGSTGSDSNIIFSNDVQGYSRVAWSSDNFIYVAATVVGSVNGETAFGQKDMTLLKYDIDGNLLWTRIFGTTSQDAAFSLGISPDGSTVYVGGYSSTTTESGAFNGNLPCIVAYSSTGVQQWTKIYSFATQSIIRDLVVANNGDIYVCGESYDALNNGMGFGKAMMARIQSDGTLIWYRTSGTTTLTEYSMSISINTALQAVVATGSTTAIMFGDNVYNQGYDGFIILFNYNGDRLVTRVFGSDKTKASSNYDDDGGGSVLSLASGDMIVSGWTSGNVFQDLTTSGNYESYHIVVSVCPAGSYCPGLSETKCPAGTYNPNTGAVSSTSCLTCPADTECPVGTASPKRSCVSDGTAMASNAYIDSLTGFDHNKSIRLYVAVPKTYQFVNFTFSGSSSSCQANNNYFPSKWVAINPPTNSDAINDACVQLYTTNITWDNMHDHCGATRQVSSDNQYINFNFRLNVNGAELISLQSDAEELSFDFYRTVDISRPIIVQFPKYVEVHSADVTVTNVLNDQGKLPAQAMLKRLVVDSQVSSQSTTLVFEMLSFASYPDIVSTDSSVVNGSVSVVSLPDGFAVTNAAITSSVVDCAAVAGAICKQSFVVTVTQSRDLCAESTTGTATFSGVYVLSFPLTCQSGYTSKGNECHGNYFTVNTKIATANFCPLMKQTNLAGQLLASIPSSGYFKLRDTASFTFVASSTDATVASATLVSARLLQADSESTWSSITWFDTNDNANNADNGKTTHGKDAHFTWSNSGSSNNNDDTTIIFSAKLLPKQIVLPSSASRSFKVSATVAVTFVNTEQSNVIQRRLLSFESYMEPSDSHDRYTSASTIVRIKSMEVEEDTVEVVESVVSSGSMLLSSNTLIVVFIVFLQLFFLF